MSADQTDDKLMVVLLSNLAQCYIKLEMNEDALEYIQQALDIDSGHVKTLYRKAKALANLFNFDESSKIFKKLKYKDEVEIVKLQREYASGNYTRLTSTKGKDQKLDLQGNFMNYVNPDIEFKFSEGQGRGLFATKAIKKGAIIMGEKAIGIGLHDFEASSEITYSYQENDTYHEDSHTILIKNLCQVAQQKGVQALRMSYLYDGSDDMELPDL